jgi:4'-phosphopantetheinyl transferase
VQIPIRGPEANEGDVGVWVVTLPEADECSAEAWSVISREERERANRLVREEDRALWIHTRAVLRRLLAGHLGTDSRLIVFGEGPHGKPEVSSGDGLQFSVSHSGSVAAITVSRDRQVGIDVERIQSDLPWEPIANRFFSTAELAFIESRPPAERRILFFHCWVRKESYLKGLGVGLKRAIDAFSVPMGSAAGTVVDLEDRPPSGADRSWCVQAIEAPDGYVAALAVEGECHNATVTITA